jgi:hypothetical protein
LNPIGIPEPPAGLHPRKHSPAISRDLREAEFVDIPHVDTAGFHELQSGKLTEAPFIGMMVSYQGEAKCLLAHEGLLRFGYRGERQALARMGVLGHPGRYNGRARLGDLNNAS